MFIWKKKKKMQKKSNITFNLICNYFASILTNSPQKKKSCVICLALPKEQQKRELHVHECNSISAKIPLFQS